MSSFFCMDGKFLQFDTVELPGAVFSRKIVFDNGFVGKTVIEIPSELWSEIFSLGLCRGDLIRVPIKVSGEDPLEIFVANSRIQKIV